MKGFLLGITTSLILFLGLLLLVWINRVKIVDEALNYAFPTLAEEVFKAMPDAYISVNIEKVITTFDAFTNAASKNAISRQDFNKLGKLLAKVLKDKKITWHEMDAIINLMQKVTKDQYKRKFKH
ncbi:MAG: hypothetical protein ACE5JB_00450 [bacterium]